MPPEPCSNAHATLQQRRHSQPPCTSLAVSRLELSNDGAPTWGPLMYPSLPSATPRCATRPHMANSLVMASPQHEESACEETCACSAVQPAPCDMAAENPKRRPQRPHSSP